MSEDFPGALRAAISASPYTLTQLAELLDERGHRVSASSLSAWQKGSSRPERLASLAALDELETLLGVPPRSLRGRLGPRQSRGGSSRRRLTGPEIWRNPEAVARVLTRVGATPEDLEHPERLSYRLRLTVDRAGRPQQQRDERLLRAVGRPAEVLHLVQRHDDLRAALEPLHLHRLRLGRFRGDRATGIAVQELFVDPPLAPGEIGWVALTYRYPGGPGAPYFNQRVQPGCREIAMEVAFAPDRLPRMVRGFYQPVTATEEQTQVEVVGDRVRSLFQFVRLDPAPGIYGIRWEW